MKNIKKFIILILLIIVFIAINPALAVSLKGAGPAADIPAGEAGVATIVGNIVKGILGFSGAIMLLLFIYGGIIWLTSQGSSEKIEKGKNILIWAIVGFIIMLGSYVITDFVINAILNQ